jgi:hypothetical protein
LRRINEYERQDPEDEHAELKRSDCLRTAIRRNLALAVDRAEQKRNNGQRHGGNLDEPATIWEEEYDYGRDKGDNDGQYGVPGNHSE